jgi:hypothetical protein
MKMTTAYKKTIMILVVLLTVAHVSGSFGGEAEDMPPLMRQINNGNWLPKDEAKELSQELYYQRAVQAYLMTLPYMNTIGMRRDGMLTDNMSFFSDPVDDICPGYAPGSLGFPRS